jgi:cytochrome P450
MLDVLPYFTAHKAHLGREKVQAALRPYFRAGYDLDDDVSPFIKRRTYVQRKYGFESDEFADWDLAMMMVATTNAVPTLFWNIVYVLSSPSITSSIREEVAAITTRTTDPKTGETRMIIDATKFSTHCPVLAAAYQESLRLSNRQMSFRVAEEDTSISAGDKTYFIKKNAVVLLPSSLYSEDPKVWGDNAHRFEPARWIKREGQKEADAKDVEKLQKKAFFPFGGGRHLCPGRHLAFAEILGMVALLVTGYDVVNAPPDGQTGTSPGGQLESGTLRIPRRESRFFGEAVPKPVGKYDILIKRKKGLEDVQWGFDVGGA